jgi:hypothetical protein
MIPNRFEKLHDTHMQHILNIMPLTYLVGHVLVGVDPHGRCIVVAPMPQTAKNPKKPQKITK